MTQPRPAAGPRDLISASGSLGTTCMAFSAGGIAMKLPEKVPYGTTTSSKLLSHDPHSGYATVVASMMARGSAISRSDLRQRPARLGQRC